MAATEGAHGYPISISMGGADYVGFTSVPAPNVECCVAGLRRCSEEQAVISTAAHEAGHAVAAFYAGIPATPLEIVVLPPCGTCEAPKARGRNQGVHLGIASAEDTLRMLAAGVQAELLWAEDLGPLTDAEQWAIEVGGLDDQGHARAVAESLRDYGWPLLDYGPPGPDPQPWNWPHQCNRARAAARLWRPQVEILSNRLVQDRRLAAADITALLNNF